MLKIKIEKSFKKDIERAKRSGKYSKEDFETLKQIIEKLQLLEPIEDKYKKHLLKGNMQGYEALHIKPDWVLVFKTNNEYLNLVMIGKHTQVYKKYK